MHRFLTCFLFGLMAFFTSAPETFALERTDVEAIVRQYIAEHPEEIIEAVSRYSAEKQREEAAKMVAEHSPTLGPADAPVTVVEFSDFRCPYCARVQDTLEKLHDRYKGQVRFVFKHNPILGPQSVDAALAAQAAHQQGKFWEYHKRLFNRQSLIGDKLFEDIAKELDLDIDRFNAARQSKALKAQVAMDMSDGENVGARGTPYFLINGQAFSGAQPLENFVAVIESELNE